MKIKQKMWALVELERGDDDGGINDTSLLYRTKEQALKSLTEFQEVAPEIFLCEVEFNACERYTKEKV